MPDQPKKGEEWDLPDGSGGVERVTITAVTPGEVVSYSSRRGTGSIYYDNFMRLATRRPK